MARANQVCRDCGGPREVGATYCVQCAAARRFSSRQMSRRKYRATYRHNDTHRKRARFYGVEYENVEPYTVYVRDQWVCQICTRPIDPECAYPHYLSASLDHIVPMSKGGGHLYSNAQASHFICNSLKSDGIW